MKYVQLIAIGFIAFSSLQCEAQKMDNTRNNGRNNKAVKTIQKSKLLKIELEEITRGTRRTVTISPDAKVVMINENTEKRTFTSKDWTAIEKLTNSLKLNDIKNYASPSTDRYHDGALAATIKMTAADGTVYESQTFDSGKPPKEISELYKLLSSNFNAKQF